MIFLLILDDVREAINLDHVGMPQSEDLARSNVIITSHSLEEMMPTFVVKIHILLPHSGVTKQMMGTPVQERRNFKLKSLWSIEAWEDIRGWFPENNKRSRILLTTRITEVARDASYPKNPFPMRFLDPEESWNLFCQKAFGKNDCPAKFEKVGKVIVGNCNGLPLMISVVAGSLSSKRTLDEWNEVAQSVSSLVNLDDYQRCSGVLTLSYNHLPSHLKACFLYFGVFKKSSEISVENLNRLWMAEGLCKLKGIGELEKEGSSLLHDLIDKSLIVACKHSLDGKIKTCKIHDLLHDLCLRESESESLLYVSNPPISDTDVLQLGRWVSFHQEPVEDFFSLPFPTYGKTRSLHFLAVKPSNFR
ncbi:putative late blight resistance protein homolog R1A-10 [Solanum stenotomum]|uniref:putative late blight resistance protein homolog R1A-10 n=1 Tax=Solanum stenotomum TaxID=172797 RepID=UPI0020D18BB3|nr:putative late blight resistance protein homolog R1A-10 [Solanum stenotomum]